MSAALEFDAGAWAAAAAVLATAAFAWHARQSRAGRGLLLLRGLVLLSFLLCVLSPVVALRRPGSAKPRLLILLDHSHGMLAPAGGRSRWEAAVSWLKSHEKEISERAEPVFFGLSDRGRKLAGWPELFGLKPSQAAFQAGEALRDVAEEAEAQGARRAWLLSDGNAESAADLEAAAAALKAPIDVLGVGPARPGKGLSFIEIKAPDFAFLHAHFTLEAGILASGMAGQKVELRLLRQDEAAAGGWSLAQSRALRPASDYETLTASFTVPAQGLGSQRYRLEAAGPGAAPHGRQLRVEVIRQKYRIMYLAGRPSAEYANLREFLKSDPNHELVSFVILRNPENPAFVPDQELSLIPFPAEEIFVTGLNQFDLFILENFSSARFRLPPAYLNSLKSFVASGGALLVMGGENAFSLGGYRGTALEELLPVTLTENRPDYVGGAFQPATLLPSHPLARLYETAEESQAAWKALPALEGYGLFGSVRPGSTVLAVHPKAKTASGEPLPVLAVRGYGKGKVLLVSSDSTWRWRLGAAADLNTATFYSRFWTRCVQYLTGSLDLSKVKFSPLPDRMPSREPATLSLRVFDEGFRPAQAQETSLTVEWTDPGGKSREVLARETEPGLYSVELTGLEPGPQRLRAWARYRGKPWGQDEVRFQWEPLSGERPIDHRFLKRVAEASGGSAAELSAVETGVLLDKLPPVRKTLEVERRLRPWASSFWLALTAGLLLLEWFLRRWKGLT